MPFGSVDRRFKPIGGLGVTAIVLSTLFTVALILGATAWVTWGSAFGLSTLLILALLGSLWIVSGVLGLVWLWRARHNAVVLEPTFVHALPQPWVILGWLVPIVSYWFPALVVRDVARASARRPIGGLTGAWWAAHLIGGLSGWLGAQFAFTNLGIGLPLVIASLIAVSVSLVLWASIIRIISAGQHQRATVPADRTVMLSDGAFPVARPSGSGSVAPVVGVVASVLVLTMGVAGVLSWSAARASQSAYYPPPYSEASSDVWTHPTTRPAYPTTRPPTQAEQPRPSQTTTYQPATKTVRVANTCGASGTGDCYLSVRTQPTTTSSVLARVPEGTALSVVCQVRGERVSSSALGTSSDVWSRLASGGYVASIFLDDPGKYSVSTPC